MSRLPFAFTVMFLASVIAVSAANLSPQQQAIEDFKQQCPEQFINLGNHPTMVTTGIPHVMEDRTIELTTAGNHKFVLNGLKAVDSDGDVATANERIRQKGTYYFITTTGTPEKGIMTLILPENDKKCRILTSSGFNRHTGN